MTKNIYDRDLLTQDVMQEWQRLLDETADILEVPAGLITRVDRKEIEILLSSKTEGNPYPVDVVSPYPDSGWYCEYTLKSRGMNLIPNATKDPQWEKNSAVENLGIIAYLGLPIERPDGELFGTVCFLDNKENPHNEMHIRLVQQIKRMVELTLRIVRDQKRIEEKDRYIKDLSKIYPICSYCKKVREKAGDWVEVEKYVKDVTGSLASHSICPDCYEREIQKI